MRGWAGSELPHETASEIGQKIRAERCKNFGMKFSAKPSQRFNMTGLNMKIQRAIHLCNRQRTGMKFNSSSVRNSIVEAAGGLGETARQSGPAKRSGETVQRSGSTRDASRHISCYRLAHEPI
jgi:hypothetical protein